MTAVVEVAPPPALLNLPVAPEEGSESNAPSRKTSEVVRRETIKSQQDIVSQMSDSVGRARERWAKIRKEVLQKTYKEPETDDGSQLIEARLAEVRAMCSHSIQADFFLSTQTPTVRDLILRLKVTSQEDFQKERRQHWKWIDLFRYAGRMGRMLANFAISRRRFMKNEDDEQKPSRGIGKESNLCSISKELRNSLITRPQYRNERDLRLIFWILRSTKAFTHLFPAEMERACATYVGYEKYDDGRILAFQNLPPDKFYFVIGGKINRIRQYKLTLGEVNKSLGFITKGMTTDPEEMEAETPRDTLMVAKGLVEVLVLQKTDYMELLRSTSGPPIDFLRRIEIFREFPCELFRENLEAINMRYFGANKIIVRDSNRTPWLHIVKSGAVKVARRQRIFDADNNKATLVKLAQGRKDANDHSHAADMLGLSARQRKLKETSLPNLPTGHSCAPPGPQRSKATLPIGFKPARKVGVARPPPSVSEHSKEAEEEEVEEEAEAVEERREEEALSPIPSVQVVIELADKTPPSSAPHYLPEDFLSPPQRNSKPMASRPTQKVAVGSLARDLNIATTDTQYADRESERRVFLTRERTELSQVLNGYRSKNEQERPSFVQLDTLGPGDIFGFKGIQKRMKDEDEVVLDHLGEPLASEDVGLTLISDGAEIVRISKRFFVANAENNTMLKVETLYKEYMNEESAKGLLKEVCAWNEYKHLVMSRSISQHSRRLK